MKILNPFKCPYKYKCVAIWLSGFFGLGCLAHLVRLILRLRLEVNEIFIPSWVSLQIFLIAAGLSLLLAVAGCRWREEKG